ncbi:hypothetical protein D1872_330190 [compost metagenome]
MIRKDGNAYGHGEANGAAVRQGEYVFFDGMPDALRNGHGLMDIAVYQQYGEFLAAVS